MYMATDRGPWPPYPQCHSFGQIPRQQGPLGALCDLSLQVEEVAFILQCSGWSWGPQVTLLSGLTRVLDGYLL